jgi:hypothetical protein
MFVPAAGVVKVTGPDTSVICVNIVPLPCNAPDMGARPRRHARSHMPHYSLYQSPIERKAETKRRYLGRVGDPNSRFERRSYRLYCLKYFKSGGA